MKLNGSDACRAERCGPLCVLFMGWVLILAHIDPYGSISDQIPWIPRDPDTTGRAQGCFCLLEKTADKISGSRPRLPGVLEFVILLKNKQTQDPFAVLWGALGLK